MNDPITEYRAPMAIFASVTVHTHIVSVSVVGVKCNYARFIVTSNSDKIPWISRVNKTAATSFASYEL